MSDTGLITEYELGNIFTRNGVIPDGGNVAGHKHNFDHVTACRSGRIRIQGVDDAGTQYETVLDMGDVALIRADVVHTLIQEPGVPKLVDSAITTFYKKLRETLLANGTLTVADVERINDETRETVSNVPAGYSCLYAHREPQGDIVQKYTGWSEAYR